MQGIRSLIESINTVEARREIEASKFVEEQKIKKALGPAEWDNLKSKLASYCDATGKTTPIKLEFLEIGIYEVTVTNLRDGRKARLSYNADVPCVIYKILGDNGHIGFRVSPDGTTVQFMTHGKPTEADEITFDLIRQLIR